MAKQVEFFYDVSSPYAYLAHEEVVRVAAAHGAQVLWRPLLLGGLFKALASSIVPFNDASPNKRELFRKDIYRWAEVRNLPLQWPSVFPMNTVRPMRVLAQLPGELQSRVASHLFRQYWAADQDIGDARVLQAILTSLGLDAEALLAGTELPEIKQALISSTQEAFVRGACGAPTFFVGPHIVSGQDRHEFGGRMRDGWHPTHG